MQDNVFVTIVVSVQYQVRDPEAYRTSTCCFTWWSFIQRLAGACLRLAVVPHPATSMSTRCMMRRFQHACYMHGTVGAVGVCVCVSRRVCVCVSRRVCVCVTTCVCDNVCWCCAVCFDVGAVEVLGGTGHCHPRLTPGWPALLSRILSCGCA
jgi:hypothetical protein